MKSQEPQEKKFRQLSDEELEKVTGGATSGINTMVCNFVTNPCEPGMWKNPMNNCQCEPKPNTIARKKVK